MHDRATYIIKAAPAACELEYVQGDVALVIGRINELSGRDIGSYILARLAKCEPDEYVYVAANRDSPAVAMFGVRGFVVGRSYPC